MIVPVVGYCEIPDSPYSIIQTEHYRALRAERDRLKRELAEATHSLKHCEADRTFWHNRYQHDRRRA